MLVKHFTFEIRIAIQRYMYPSVYGLTGVPLGKGISEHPLDIGPLDIEISEEPQALTYILSQHH